ncbi:cytochrome c biogenesis CcdA family protein [Aliifodinibius sp. S!AR15-10]|uniref:cytochrome c biogenesis CcdA family protein n=1 Tax=Aliifodinibius sp. S!AR15-10 TaxID=2950437 RepID=UPI00286051E3|nr:cytochrome c biogenesis CcdA family protein [Aliifodinibius sp. S!AR15-10]MDR8392934.1 cytochrome c biogenesis CcdA family protein [Aliifodinibius sp. S!AR15-10]
MDFISFSFMQGVLAFLAPCAVALLPGYIVAFISRNSQDDPPLARRLYRGLKLALLSILGILVVYAIAGGMIIAAAQVLKDYMKWITIGMGVVLIVLGILMVMGKNVSFSLNMNNATEQTEAVEAFVFGIAYAIGALGCLFPLFLVVATQALAAPTAWQGASYIGAYFVGLSGMMIATILLSTFAKDLLMKYLRKILPHMERVTGVLLILAGIYVIHYQLVLI